MAITLKGYADIIARAVDPLGAHIEIDYPTDNLVVLLGNKGFAITRMWLENYDPKVVAEDAASIVRDIAAGLGESMNKRYTTPVKIRSRDELFCRNLTTTFDSN